MSGLMTAAAPAKSTVAAGVRLVGLEGSSSGDGKKSTAGGKKSTADAGVRLVGFEGSSSSGGKSTAHGTFK